MASAPPAEFILGDPPLPSYEEAMSHPYPQDFGPPPPSYSKATQQPCPAQVYNPSVPPVTAPPVVTVQRVFVQHTFTDQPVQMQCPVCMQLVVTRLEHRSGAAAWVICAGLFIFGCAYGCCLIPFCMDDLKDVTHYCPNCNNVLGVYKRL
ncbi:lipopolysaccharide-induced tumor necrosis factor-alpha factor homolog isoform X2 [Scleropages formosus]|uniref:Lipopolysaccharide-induced TNF factor n=2 Tax=Scleropages formosus TaxID=113540 RepID=A0A8C9WE33_SCLFO|nr:lipopolysaccharide-induced tumor necrosis factor-alpha factor homolog isoform X2 [Scleropages formosus]XP_018594950.1 lipopolysaccharide-induced tumor necrosis factor-alpha factor homolog isoform X2 [Scleropages formosus]XP_018594960.1 lipopolysaccharide-induced tumor necrosis factor-alpha factor homolog isoform X2 [Scleropages formosus]XP_018594969.1 lipopolysaccharide-induced tumor necrosis factor-alpha factor homolog isoform X2 [Scleropages formosus]XP_018594979.1 lipopolysaccharide-induc